jgi:phenylpyruvate tautomerase PptA (4-oxalocrotonate tautomerase family)
MPIMEVRYPAGRLDAAAKAVLAKKLTDILIRMEGGAGTDGGRGFAWVLFTEFPAGDFWVGGHADEAFVSQPGPFLVHVTIPEGYMNAVHKNEVHAWVMQAIAEATGNPCPQLGAGSVLVIIDEVTEGNWSADGLPIHLASIAKTVGMPADGERMQWSHAYFDAKARQFAAAGYPSDLGGLWPNKARAASDVLKRAGGLSVRRLRHSQRRDFGKWYGAHRNVRYLRNAT